ncbi:imidazolonepropionase [Halobacillus sp. KGW1]|uniref:imidazolonepropionase n=1 Tax=Halobacillus sp. KGW1 TaxID=1793726 RepID=UPI000B0A27E8|nr:imidazolonepropionase [Halobacillus sp. KGW1]
MLDLVIDRIGELILPEKGPLKGEAMAELPVRRNAALGIQNGKVTWIGNQGEAAPARTYVDARHQVVSPGLIDPHTHLVFGGSREQELPLKQAGMPYLEILKRGGGILATVEKTRLATETGLYEKGKATLARMAAHGVTAVEAKSGYGLDRETERKQLRVIKRLGEEGMLTVVPTFLGPHAIPDSMAPDVFLQDMIDLLSDIKNESLARFTDIFCETGVFTVDQSRRFMEASKKLGFPVKIHADEIDALGGTELAVELEAVSADHLVAATEVGMEKLAAGRTIAVLLPGTTFYLGKDAYADARRMLGKGAAVALATDFNPGSCVTENLQLIMSLAALKLKMTAEEIWNAVTTNAACAIGLENTAGRIEIGAAADLVLWDIPNYTYLPYHYGVNHARSVWKDGRNIWEKRDADVFPLR